MFGKIPFPWKNSFYFIGWLTINSILPKCLDPWEEGWLQNLTLFPGANLLSLKKTTDKSSPTGLHRRMDSCYQGSLRVCGFILDLRHGVGVASCKNPWRPRSWCPLLSEHQMCHFNKAPLSCGSKFVHLKIRELNWIISEFYSSCCNPLQGGISTV